MSTDDLTDHERRVLRATFTNLPDHTYGTREEHLAWCKQRALEYVDANDLKNAWASMVSDLGKHPDTRSHPGIQLGMMLMMTSGLNTAEDMRHHIEGFN